MDFIKATHIPQFPEKLPGTFWGITTVFSVVPSVNRIQNYHIFRERSQRQGLQLCTVELAFDNQPFELTLNDADILIQVRGGDKNKMWQKEAMLNIALKRLPPECDKIAWIDSDVIFENDQWIQQTSHLLEKYRVIQPFSMYMHLKNGQVPEDINITKTEPGFGENQKHFGCIYARDHRPDRDGHPGFVWASRRSVFENLGFYDRHILGTADGMISYAFFGLDRVVDDSCVPDEMRDHLLRYGHTLSERVGGSVFYCPGFLFHVWHGKMMNRRYVSKGVILKKSHFDPDRDVFNNAFGLLEWNCHKKSTQKAIKKYFFARNEDNHRWRSLRYFFFFFSLNDRLSMIKNLLPKTVQNHWFYRSFVKRVSLLLKNRV